MPCYDSRDDDYNRELATRNEFFKAALCGILSTGSDVLSKVNWKETGIARKDVEAWFAQHQREDAAKKKRQADIRRTEVVKQNAILKLSPEELKALNISLKKAFK